jgi:hypothetical protein
MIPLNRFLLVSVTEEKEETNKKPYEVVEIIDVSSESKFASVLNKGDKVVVEGHMLRNVDVFGDKATLIEDNYVLGKC